MSTIKQDDFALDIRTIDSGPATHGIPSGDCTSDGCGPTPASAGIADC